MDIVLEQIMLYVDQIAGLVNDSAPMVWEMLIRQVYVEALRYGIFVLLGIGILVVSGIFFKKVKKASPKRQSSYDDMSPQTAWLTGAIITLVIGVFVLILSLYPMLARLINPNWYAIRLLLQTAGIGG